MIAHLLPQVQSAQAGIKRRKAALLLMIFLRYPQLHLELWYLRLLILTLHLTPSITPENKQAKSGSTLRQVEQGSQHRHGSPPRTSTRKHRPSSGSMTPDQKSPSRTPPTRRPRPRPMTPDQKQAKSLAKLRTLGSQHIGLPSPPASPITPGSPVTPDSAATYGGFGHQTSNLAYSAARSCPSDYVDRENLSPSRRVVKGRRRRIR
mmetsp:Transcript_5774/g.9105  ORF Transcript_5774/g.9105 Transcript_5774/m.9105 type:complete len:206 (-) Transcript_5774:104-721(-)